MGTTADKLNKIIATKSDIKNAIIEKGVDVSDSDVFSSYGDKIRNIKSGSTLPSPFIDRIDLCKKYKAKGIDFAWDDSVFGYSYNRGYSSSYAAYYYLDINTKLNTIISNSKSNITVFSDKFFSYDSYMSNLASESIVRNGVYHRTTNDISGELGYYDFNNALYISLGECFGMSGQDRMKVFGIEGFLTVKFPKIYAPKCAFLKIFGRAYDYSDGIFYTPGGNPYEILPDALDLYDEDIYRVHIYPEGKKPYCSFNFSNTVNLDMLVESFPINSTGVIGKIYYDTSSYYPPRFTSAQKDKLREKGWIVTVS